MPAGKNICNCPLPPGGRAVCSEEQLAICRVVNGVAFTECVNLGDYSTDVGSRIALNTALMHITKRSRSSRRSLSRVSANLLIRGKYFSPIAGDVTFRLPESLAIRVRKNVARKFIGHKKMRR